MVYRYLSPEVRVVELDFSQIIVPSHVAVGAYVGNFTWGPVEEVRVVTSESDLIRQFGKPSETNYLDFTTAAQFFGYSNHLKVVRVISDECRNAASGGDGFGLTFDTTVLNGQISSITINNPGTGYVPGDIVFINGSPERAKVMITKVGNNGAVTDVDLLTNGDGYAASASNVDTTILNNVVVKNEDHFEAQTHLPQFIAKYPGDLGNSIGVGIVNASHFDMWTFKERFITPPTAKIKKWNANGVENQFKETLRNDNNDPIPFPHVGSTNPNDGNDFTVEGAILERGLQPGQYQVSYDATTGETTFTVNVQTDTFTGTGSDWEFALTVPEWPYENIGFKVDIDGTELTPFSDDTKPVPVGHAAIRGGKLVIGTNLASFDGKLGVNTYTITGVTGISDARVWVDGVEKTVVTTAPTNDTEVQVVDNGGNTDIIFFPGSIGVGNDNIVVRWGFPAAGSTITATYGYPKAGADVVKAFWDQQDVHVVIYDREGKWTGIKDHVLEVYANLSMDENAKDENGLANYFRRVLNDRSLYVWTAPHPISTELPVVFGNHELTGGVDGSVEYSSDEDYFTGWRIFRDKETYDVTHLIVGDRSIAVKKFVIENVAEFRKDCIAWISPSKSAVFTRRFDILQKVLEERTAFNSSSYAAMDNNWKLVYSPWIDRKVWVPTCVDSAGIYSRATNNFYPWVPGAGYNRGHLVNVLRLAWSPNKTERDELYVSPRNINPVFHDNYDGTILFGNKTMQAKESAFDRINVRLLFILLEKSIAKAAKYFLFELNTPFTRARFRNMVVPFLREVKALDGIEDYKVVCDERNNPEYVRARHELIADILIKPAYSIEYITLRFSAVGPDMSFDYVIKELTT